MLPGVLGDGPVLGAGAPVRGVSTQGDPSDASDPLAHSRERESDVVDATIAVRQDDLLEQVVIQGNLASLTSGQRAHYYGRVCASIGLNPLTRPFEYLTLNNKLVLYARKDATDQLRNLRRVSLTITARETLGDLYVVTARAVLPDGRTDEEIGAVPIAGLKGEALANAMMKASTKAKRRVTLSVCGLGMLDESEVESIPDAAIHREPAPVDEEMAERQRTARAMNPPREEATEPAGAPGDDVDALTGLELVDACERLRRALEAASLPYQAMPHPRTNKNLRDWWHAGSALLAARP